MTELINTHGLMKRFGDIIAVNGISLTVQRGEVLGFLGPNGAGKSTTMKMITGFLRPDEGRVAIAGTDMETQPIKAKSSIGYLPEGAPAYADMTARSFLKFIAEVRGFDGAVLGACRTAHPSRASGRAADGLGAARAAGAVAADRRGLRAAVLGLARAGAVSGHA